MPPDEITDTPTTEEPKVEETKVEEPKVEEPKEDQPDPKEVKAALNLFNALRNPETSMAALRGLAEVAGLDLAKREDRKEMKKSVAALIQEGLGEDNSILAERLGPLLEKVIAEAVEERVKPITTQISEREKNEFAVRIDTAFEDLEKETKGFSKQLEKEMVALMDDISPGATTKPETYIRHIYNLAKSRFDEAERLKAQNKKMDENKKRPPVQTGANTDRIKSGSKLPTIREAVEAAMRGETLE